MIDYCPISKSNQIRELESEVECKKRKITELEAEVTRLQALTTPVPISDVTLVDGAEWLGRRKHHDWVEVTYIEEFTAKSGERHPTGFYRDSDIDPVEITHVLPLPEVPK